MGRRRGLLRGTQGPYAGYKYWRFRPANYLGTPLSQAYFRIYELYLYQSYDQAGPSIPTTALTSNTGDSSFSVTISTETATTDEGWMAFDDNESTSWYPGVSAVTPWLVVELNRNRLFKSLTIKTYNNNSGGTHILVEASDTGAWAGEEVEIGLTDNFSTTISTKSWNLYGDEYPTVPGAITETGTEISSISASVIAATPPSGETIVAYHWYIGGVFKKETAGLTVTLTGLIPGTSNRVTVKAEASGGNISNSSYFKDIQTDTLGVTYVKDNGSGSYQHYRFQNYHANAASKNVGFITRIESYAAVDLGGGRWPSAAVTSETSDANFTITKGYEYSATYAAWKAFNLATNSGWWTLSLGVAADNWVQVDIGEPDTFESVYIAFYGTTYHKCDQMRIMGSATGAFAGEETIIGTVSEILAGGVSPVDCQFNLDTNTYGANVITNGDFAGGLTDWTTVTGTPSVVSGKLILEANEATKQLHTMTGSHLFKITISNMTAGELDFDLDGTTVKTLDENGTHQFIHTPTGQGVELTANASFDGEIDNVEVFPIN